MKKNDPIIVTGAFGLAGSAVCEHLRSHLYTCVIPLGRKDLDLRDAAEVQSKFSLIKPKYVFHAAATVYGIGGNLKNQAKSIYDNTLINTNVIHACHTTGVEKLTVMGTNAIYPETAFVPYREKDIFNGRPHYAEAGYGHAKRHMLAMLEAYRTSFDMKYVYLVSGNLYGPRDRFDINNGHVLPSLIAKFSEAKDSGDQVVVWGDGRPARDFLYSADLAEIVRIVLTDETTGPINTGHGRLTTIFEVVAALCELSGVPLSDVVFDEKQPNGRMRCCADLSRLHALGFKPAFDLRQGLKLTWDWYRDRQ